jgi:hypothetical protein
METPAERARREREELAREVVRRRAAEQKEALQAEAARRRLAPFLRAVWPVVEKKDELEWSPHLDALALHLEAVEAGKIHNIAVSLPAGCTKTRLFMEAFPAWVLGRDPTRRILCISNSSSLAERSSLACRDILRSDWYRRYFPHVVISDDQDTKMSYKTTQGGYRISKPVMSKITGTKADIIIIDDANDAEQVLSKTIADSIKSWYDRGLHDRVNSFKDSRRVAVAQRLSTNDLIGHLVSVYQYEYLFLPEEFDPKRRFTSSIGWTDWRTEAGELLRPGRFGPTEVAVARRRPDYVSKHQQDPSAEEQAFFKREWFERRWHYGPVAGQIVLPSSDPKEPDYRFDLGSAMRFATIDAAASAKTSADNTACTVFALSPRGDLVILDCILRHVDIPDQPKVLAEIQAKHAPPVLGIERAGANASMYQFAVHRGFTAVALEPKGRDKLVRAQPAILNAAAGRIWLPTNGLVTGFDVEGFLAELVQFTGQDGGQDDRVDTLSMAHDLMPMLSQVVVGRGFRPQSVSSVGGDSRMPLAGVPIPPVAGAKGGVPLIPGAGQFRPAVIVPGGRAVGR